MIVASLLLASAPAACPIDLRIARAEQLVSGAFARATEDVPIQRGYRPGGNGLPPFAQVNWLDDGRFWYEARRDGIRHIVLVNPLTARREAFVIGSDGPARFDPVKNQVVIDEAAARATAVSPGGRFSAWSRSHNLFVGNPGQWERRITRDGGPWYSFDPGLARSNPVETDMSGAAPQVNWIGEGPWFWIERFDQRRVRDVWLADALSSAGPTVRRQKMPYPGDRELPRPEIWLVNAATARAHRIDSAGWDYLGNMDIGAGGIAPSRDGKQLFFARIMRGYDRIELAAASIKGGVRTVLREPGGASGIRYLEFAELADGFLWKSDRDGWAHYYLYDRDGVLVRQVTHGAFSVDRIVHVDEEKGDMLFTAFADDKGSSGRAQLHRVRLDGTDLRRLDADSATHVLSARPDGAYFVDSILSPDAMPKMTLRDRGGRELAVLEQAAADRFDRVGWRPPVPLDLKAADGVTRIEGMMWLPPAIEAHARLPVIVQAYPGPSNDVVPTGFVPAHPNAALAELGFVVVTFGQRGGAPTRGRDYQFFAREPGRMRDYPIADNAAALAALARQYPFVDLDRVGIWGRSGGGFMAVTAMLTRPDLYKVGVAIAGNHDNNIYEQNSTEFNFGRYPGPYPSNAEIAGQLRGNLLLVHGDMDEDVHVAHSLRLVRSLIDADKRFDLLVLPGEGHSGYAPATERYLQRKIWEYFLVHLQGMAPCEGANLGEVRPSLLSKGILP